MFMDVKRSGILLQPGSRVPALPVCSHIPRHNDSISAASLALTSGRGVTFKRCAIKLLNPQIA